MTDRVEWRVCPGCGAQERLTEAELAKHIERNHPLLTHASSNRVHGSCLVCGYDRPFRVWGADTHHGVCDECYDRADPVGRIIPKREADYIEQLRALAAEGKVAADLPGRVERAVRLACSATPNRVLRSDVADRINKLRTMNRRRESGDFTAEYTDGYEDALNDLHDALEGWCGPDFRIEDAT